MSYLDVFNLLQNFIFQFAQPYSYGLRRNLSNLGNLMFDQFYIGRAHTRDIIGLVCKCAYRIAIQVVDANSAISIFGNFYNLYSKVSIVPSIFKNRAGQNFKI